MPMYHLAKYASICQMLIRKVKICYSQVLPINARYDLNKLQHKHGQQGKPSSFLILFTTWIHGDFKCYSETSKYALLLGTSHHRLT